MEKFPRSKKTDSKNAFVSSKVASTATLTKDVSQICSNNESYILLTTFVPAENTQYEIKQAEEHQGEFINFKLIFQHYY